jgi:hypothetical protein
MSPAPPEPRDETTEESASEPPPILGSWRALYTLIAVALAIEILFCGWLTRLGR